METTPKPKKFVVADRVVGRYWQVHVATSNAYDWIDTVIDRFGNATRGLEWQKPIGKVSVVISPCYDPEDVAAYLESYNDWGN